MNWLVLLSLSSLLHLCHGLRILAVFPFPQKSHHIIFNALLEALVDRGHQVSVYSGYRIKTNSPNYKHHHINTGMKLLEGCTYEKFKKHFDKEPFFGLPPVQSGPESKLSEETLSLPEIRRLISSNETFDVVILETVFAQEALVGFGYRFSAPVVTVCTSISIPFLYSIMGNPYPIAYHPLVTQPYSSQLSFSQRVKTFTLYLNYLMYSYYWHLPRQQSLYEQHFSATTQKPLPPLIDLLTEMAAVLMCTQPEVGRARPLVPNMISVGGLHIPKKLKPLPQDIQKFMDESQHGVIYFSLGSTFSGLPEHILRAFTTVFESIPQRVLWKIETPPSNLPPNVMTGQWVPQTSVLAHNACVAFITHGGLLSLLEAAHFAVPLVGVALFADQGFNIAKIEEAQIGVRLRISTISAASVAAAVVQIIQNPIYKHNMQLLSASLRDKQVSPLDTAVHWVEYSARHHGAPHLRSPARHIHFFHYFLLDVILFLLLVVLILFVLLKTLLRFVLFAFNNKYVDKSKIS